MKACPHADQHAHFRFTSFDRFSSFHRFTTAEFFLKSFGKYVTPLALVAGFSPGIIAYCSMHVSNLGLAQWTNAGVLLELLSRGFFGDPSTVSLADRLHIVTLRFRKWCGLHGIAQSQAFLTVGMLHIGPSSSAPELTLKAYHGRVFVAFLASCCQALLSSQGEGDDELVLLLAVSHTLAQWHLKVESYPRYLTPAQGDHLIELSNHFLHCYKALAVRHSAKGSLAFPLRPKLHAFAEINYFARQQCLNPRFRHCFKDEDMMGAVKHVARRVHKGLLELRTLCRLLMLYESKAVLVREQTL